MTGQTVNGVFRDFITDGIPITGAHEPAKAEIRNLFNAFNLELRGANAGALVQTSLAGLQSLAPDDNTLAWVVGDGSSSNDGVYQYNSTLTTWSKVATLPYNIIYLNNADAGTANAIIVTTSVGIPDAAYGSLYLLNITQDNSTGGVTVAINGDAAVPLVTNTSGEIPDGYLTVGMGVLCIDDGTNLRLLSYGDSDAAALAAANSASAALASENNAAASAAQATTELNTSLYQQVISIDDTDSPYSVTSGEEGALYQVDTTNGNVIINPSSLAVYGENFKFGVVKTDNSANTITINASGSDTFNGNNSIVIDIQYEVHTLVGNSSTNKWTAAVSYTLAATALPTLIVYDEKPNGTDGGTPSLGTNIRTITTEQTNTITGASTTTSSITLPAGTYEINAHSAGRGASDESVQHKLYLWNSTDSSLVLDGSSERVSASGDTIRSFIIGQFTIASTKVFQIRHYVDNVIDNGFGWATSMGGSHKEIYTMCIIRKIA